MNLLRLQNANDYIELSVTRYEFEDAEDSLEWLMLYGKVFVKGQEIEGEDPTIEVDDAESLKAWAQKMLVEPYTSGWAPIEPNLYFEYNCETNVLEIYFRPERTLYYSGKKIKGKVFKKRCEKSDWESIIFWCEQVENEFPMREPKKVSIQFENVYERDIDLLIINSLSKKFGICDLFAEQMGIEEYRVEEIIHSATDLHGESDISVVLSSHGKRHLILIEDKIDAVAQPMQYERYIKRGEKAVENGEVSTYSVFIIAPQEYLDRNKTAKKYQYKISYEEMLEEFTSENDVYATALLNKALMKSKEIIIDESVTRFWAEYYKYQEKYYPQLKLHKNSVEKSSRATWPDFKTVLKKTKILHKSEQGKVDLEFSGMAEKINSLANLLKDYIDEDMHWHVTGKSASVGIDVRKLDFSEPFSQYEDDMATVFDAVNRLNLLAIKIQDEGLLCEME